MKFAVAVTFTILSASAANAETYQRVAPVNQPTMQPLYQPATQATVQPVVPVQPVQQPQIQPGQLQPIAPIPTQANQGQPSPTSAAAAPDVNGYTNEKYKTVQGYDIYNSRNQRVGNVLNKPQRPAPAYTAPLHQPTAPQAYAPAYPAAPAATAPSQLAPIVPVEPVRP